MDDKQIVIIFSKEIEKSMKKEKNAIERSQERYLSSAIGKLQSS